MTPLEVGGIVAASAIGFVSIWLGVSALISWIGGWHRLAQQYRATSDTTTSRIRLWNAWMRFGTSYRNAIGLDCQTQGLSLSVLWLFRFCHPQLFIPWDDIHYTEGRFFWFFTRGRLILGRDAQIPLSFYDREAREFVARYIRNPQTRVPG